MAKSQGTSTLVNAGKNVSFCLSVSLSLSVCLPVCASSARYMFLLSTFVSFLHSLFICLYISKAPCNQCSSAGPIPHGTLKEFFQCAISAAFNLSRT
jgi:hypothetical protein